MSDTLATKQDVHELGTRIDWLEKHLDTRLLEFEKRVEIRFEKQGAHFREQLADLERRMTMRLGGIMVAGIGAMSALVKIL